MNPVLEIYRSCGEILRDPEDSAPSVSKRISEFHDALRKAGREMVTNNQVSEETVEKLHVELISDEEYMAGANQLWDEEIEKAEGAKKGLESGSCRKDTRNCWEEGRWTSE